MFVTLPDVVEVSREAGLVDLFDHGSGERLDEETLDVFIGDVWFWKGFWMGFRFWGGLEVWCRGSVVGYGW